MKQGHARTKVTGLHHSKGFVLDFTLIALAFALTKA